MKAEDLQVKEALLAAGFDVEPIAVRGDLFEALALILAQDPVGHEDFVDLQRTILTDAQHREDHVEYMRARAERSTVLACPECGQRPDVGLGYWSSTGEVLIVCMNHTSGAVTRAGHTLIGALQNWDADDWYAPGPVRQPFQL